MPTLWRAPRVYTTLAVVAATLLLALSAGRAAEPEFPPLTGRVVDAADILSAPVREQLTQMVARQQASTGQQVVVVTLKSLQGFTIEEFGYQLGRHWGIGEKGQNNGALLIVAPNERKVRIEVGYGLEDRLTDAESRTIIDQQMLPLFRQGDFSAGTLQGAAAILRVLGGGQAIRPGTTVSPIGTAGIAVVAFLPVLLFFFIPGLILFAALRSHGRGRSSHDSGGDGSSYSSGGGSSGGDSFSGGGGDFGGGGASDSW